MENKNNFEQNIDNIINNLKDVKYEEPEDVKMSCESDKNPPVDIENEKKKKNEEECLKFKELEKKCINYSIANNQKNINNKSIHQISFNMNKIQITNKPKNFIVNKYCNQKKEYKKYLKNQMIIDDNL